MRLTVVVENGAERMDLITEHGLAIHIDDGREGGFFDTGAGGAVLPNARALGIDLSRTGWIALSHGHDDHCGGLSPLAGAIGSLDLYAHPAAFRSRYSHTASGEAVSSGAPGTDALPPGVRLHRVTEPTEIRPGVLLTGEVPRTTDFEPASDRYRLGESPDAPVDPFGDDMALVLDTSGGKVVLLGCAHAGVVNTLRHVRALTDAAPLRAVIGGFHLTHASEERIRRTVAELRALGVERLSGLHCTGQTALRIFREAFGDRIVPMAAGSTLSF